MPRLVLKRKNCISLFSVQILLLRLVLYSLESRMVSAFYDHLLILYQFIFWNMSVFFTSAASTALKMAFKDLYQKGQLTSAI